MISKSDLKKLLVIAAVFIGFYHLPTGNERFSNAVLESIYLVKWYAQEHVLLCLIPAFFIAGAISVFVSQASVMKYLGASANKIVSYSVASVSGTILAVCSCTILPLFAGIYKMGAGLGPAVTFLYAGPAINILAIILTARVLGLKIGIARAVGAIVFSVIIGLLMHFIYRNSDQNINSKNNSIIADENPRKLWQNALYFFSMAGILVFANWAKPQEQTGIWFSIFQSKWLITCVFTAGLYVILATWFKVNKLKMLILGLITLILAIIFRSNPIIPFSASIVGLSVILSTEKGENEQWLESTVSYTIKIIPLLFAGVLIAGFLLGRPGENGIIPSGWIESAVGGNSLRANLFASVAGALMYFATLTEVPILQGLMNSGMGQGPALALLLAGPALSLPNMLVIRSIMGTGKTLVFVFLVVIMATISGIIFGTFF